MADGPDWLTGLVSMIPSIGSWAGLLTPSTMLITPAAQKLGMLPQETPNQATEGPLTAFRGGTSAIGTAFGFLADKDPSKLATGGPLYGLHRAGIGEQGDEWDRGAIGMLGAGFSKLGMLATYGALATTQDSWTDAGTLFDPDLRKKAWDVAFDPSQGVDFGMAMLAEKSTLEDPDGLQKLRGEMDSTWWGNFVAGTMSIAMYAATDPTKVAGRAVKAGRAPNYIADPLKAEEYAQVLNGTKRYFHGTTDTFGKSITENGIAPNAKGGKFNLTDNLERARIHSDEAAQAYGGKPVVYEVDGNGLPLTQGWQGDSHFTGRGRIGPDRIKPVSPDEVTKGFVPTSGGGAKNYTKAFLSAKGKPIKNQDPEYVVSRQIDGLKPLDNETNPNTVANWLDPMWGDGSDAVRVAMPRLAEFYADLGKISDLDLQRSAKLNVTYAMTGSQSAREWLASNVPMVAAKIQRTTMAPQGFTTLDNAMKGFVAAGSDIEKFDLGLYLDNANGPVASAEMKAYGEMVKKVQGFRATVELGGALGTPVIATHSKLGVQATPRMLEKLKTGINQYAMDSYYLQGGPSGRTIRVVTAFTQPGVNGYIHLKDGLLGNKQLMLTLKDYERNVGSSRITPEYITAVSERYLKATQLERQDIIANVNRDLLTGVAEKYGPEAMAARGAPMTPEFVQQMTKDMNTGFKRGREFANNKAKLAERNGDDVAWITDVTGGDTILDRAHLQAQLDDTAPLLDWKTANEAVDAAWKQNRMDKALTTSGMNTAHNGMRGLMAYHRWWKYAQLGAPVWLSERSLTPALVPQ